MEVMYLIMEEVTSICSTSTRTKGLLLWKTRVSPTSLGPFCLVHPHLSPVSFTSICVLWSSQHKGRERGLGQPGVSGSGQGTRQPAAHGVCTHLLLVASLPRQRDVTSSWYNTDNILLYITLYSYKALLHVK